MQSNRMNLVHDPVWQMETILPPGPTVVSWRWRSTGFPHPDRVNVCTQFVRHSGAGRNPGFRSTNWIPAYAGMTEHSRCAHTVTRQREIARGWTRCTDPVWNARKMAIYKRSHLEAAW